MKEYMNYIDQLADEEIDLLNQKVESATEIYKDIFLIFKDTNSVSSSLQLANQYIQEKDYANAYRAFLYSLNYLIHINEQLMEKYFSLQESLSEYHDFKE